jgi:hypothetical protein
VRHAADRPEHRNRKSVQLIPSDPTKFVGFFLLRANARFQNISLTRRCEFTNNFSNRECADSHSKKTFRHRAQKNDKIFLADILFGKNFYFGFCYKLFSCHLNCKTCYSCLGSTYTNQ